MTVSAHTKNIERVLITLESAFEQGFEGNPGVSSQASFTINGYSLNKNDNAAV
ncbi:MAG: hypothetical protein KZQ86_11240 [Candidatus Thiodiazotropha sp. (ex Lucinoma kastoroae)]|nr:hypothetical protein [Candidatus Thiodiazotropha sp. (ex Rostrolucina anterorostrata)]MCU7860375.1 hypothetical protein [Candidatus Thiodiazotropha sp. (ex Lucinoma kastoroae)]